jgi:radical SAM superfamily enzyme YgiQ (UPF0313 family)
LDRQRLAIHPNAVLFHHKGAFLGGRLCGSVPPVRLAEADLVVLSLFLAGREPGEAVRELVSGPLARYLPGVPPAKALLGWLEHLHRAQLLVNATPDPAPSGTGLGLADCRAAGAVPGGRSYRLPANFLLRPVPGGFEAFSPRSGKFHVLGLEPALLLAAFGQGRTANAVVREKSAIGGPGERRAALQWLVREGLLVEARARESAPPRRAPSAAGEAAGASLPSGPGWREIEPDGRIPVYFVPHMENHYPLALGMIASALEAHDEGALLARFRLLPITYMSPRDFLEGPYRKFGPGVWLFSNYMWSVTQNLKVSEAVKEHDARNLTIHGGPSTPAYEAACTDFMRKYASVDVAVHGEGEVTATRLFECIRRLGDGRIGYEPESLAEVAGITFRTAAGGGQLTRTGPRVRLREVDVIPSPYIRGLFDHYAGRVDAAIVETNRGCPFACTFCDWGSATNGKVAKFDMERIRQEIDWVGRNRVRVLWIADANFGMLKRDTEIARWIVEVKSRHGFPQEVVVNYTKNTTGRLADIIRVFTQGRIVSQGIISIQTSDEQTLDVINRENIKTEKYDELIGVFDAAGLPLSTDLMIGLPGITVEAFDRDLQRYIDVDVQVKAYPTQLLPNSPMADPEYMEKYRIQVDENDFLVSCYSYTREDLQRMKAVYEVYVATEGYGALRYLMRYLQWEHGIAALQVMHALMDAVKADPGRCPAVTWVLRFFNTQKCMPGGWRRFYEEAAGLICERFGIARDPAFEVALKVNEAAMPDEALPYPRTIRLPHDFVAWFREHNVRVGRPETVRPLASYPPGEFTVEDPDGMAGINFDYQQYDSHQYFWELRSPIARAQSAADVRERQPSFGGEGARPHAVQ